MPDKEASWSSTVPEVPYLMIWPWILRVSRLSSGPSIINKFGGGWWPVLLAISPKIPSGAGALALQQGQAVPAAGGSFARMEQ